VTGKPLSQGGIDGRTEATGLGVYFAARNFMKDVSVLEKVGMTAGLHDKSIVVQGFGNVGYYAAKFFSERSGSKIIAIVEWDSCVINEDGLDIEALQAWRLENGTVNGFPGATKILEGDDAVQGLELECDILVPAALEKTINRENAGRIKAKFIVEGANGPVTPAAEAILAEKNILVAPDILCNAGGVTVSYFEWLKNLQHVRFGRMTKKWEETQKELVLRLFDQLSKSPMTEVEREAFKRGPTEKDIVFSGLEDTMSIATKRLIAVANERNCSYRIAGFVTAIEKIAHVYEEAGITQ
jgi:glutamate dehydrogenase (NAD(P)+)